MSEPAQTNSPIEARSEELTDAKKAAAPAPLEPEDFYYENGLVVFTAAYHLKRGYCCNSGCRHCPFR
jgi:Family of unknown function (DUF5522)